MPAGAAYLGGELRRTPGHDGHDGQTRLASHVNLFAGWSLFSTTCLSPASAESLTNSRHGTLRALAKITASFRRRLTDLPFRDGRDGVVPVAVEVVILDVELFQGCLWDLDALRIVPPVDVADDIQTGFCLSRESGVCEEFGYQAARRKACILLVSCFR